MIQTCEKVISEEEGQWPLCCGKPARYSMTTGNRTIRLCGVHARKYIKANLPWHKVTPLKPEASHD